MNLSILQRAWIYGHKGVQDPHDVAAVVLAGAIGGGVVERMVAKGVMVWGGVVGAQPKKSPISDVAYNYDTYRSESMRSVVGA